MPSRRSKRPVSRRRAWATCGFGICPTRPSSAASPWSPDAVIQRLLAYVPFMSSPGAPLYKGRIMHLKGRFFDEKEAIAYYQKARPRNQAVAEEMPKIAKACYEAFRQQSEGRMAAT